jgi:hypothetical protein
LDSAEKPFGSVVYNVVGNFRLGVGVLWISFAPSFAHPDILP